MHIRINSLFYLEPCEKFASRQYNWFRAIICVIFCVFFYHLYIYHRLDSQVIIVRYSQFVY